MKQSFFLINAAHEIRNFFNKMQLFRSVNINLLLLNKISVFKQNCLIRGLHAGNYGNNIVKKVSKQLNET